MHWDAGHDNIIGSDRISLPTPGLSATLTLGLFGVARHPPAIDCKRKIELSISNSGGRPQLNRVSPDGHSPYERNDARESSRASLDRYRKTRHCESRRWKDL